MTKRAAIASAMTRFASFIIFAMMALLFSAVQCAAGSPQDITNIIRYTPPTDFWGGAARGTRSDPGDNPLSLDGPELLHYVYPNRGDVIFKIGLAGAYFGKGKIVKFLSTEPSDLQKYMEAEYQGRFPLVTVTPAVLGTVSGLTAVSMDGTRPRPGEADLFAFLLGSDLHEYRA